MSASEARWREIAPGVHVRRHQELNLNCVLVVGDERALLVDTRSYHQHGVELRGAVGEITDLELDVVNTHAHYDHCFGNSAFRDCRIYARSDMCTELMATAQLQRDQVVEHLRATDRAEMAEDFAATEIVPPQYLIDADTELDLGGRTVHLLLCGPAHTGHDLAVAVPDAGVMIPADLIEEGADPHMDEAYPLEWGRSLRDLMERPAAREATIWVPGHGDVVDRDFAEGQATQLERLADRLTEALEEGRRDLDALLSVTRGIGFADETLREAAMRALEQRPL